MPSARATSTHFQHYGRGAELRLRPVPKTSRLPSDEAEFPFVAGVVDGVVTGRAPPAGLEGGSAGRVADTFTAAQRLRSRNAFTRDDGTPLNYTLVDIDDWCKNTFEVVSQLRINSEYSYHRYDVLLLKKKYNGIDSTEEESAELIESFNEQLEV